MDTMTVLMSVLFTMLGIPLFILLVVAVVALLIARMWRDTANRALSIPEQLISELTKSIGMRGKKGNQGAENGRSYRYMRKKYLLTRSENELFQILTSAVGSQYLILPQVRLSGLLYERVKGQSWKTALRKINQKSLDFVLCDKVDVSPKLAIELDDITHDRPHRQERDRFVEHALADAGLPLLRLRAKNRIDVTDLALKIQEIALD